MSREAHFLENLSSDFWTRGHCAWVHEKSTSISCFDKLSHLGFCKGGILGFELRVCDVARCFEHAVDGVKVCNSGVCFRVRDYKNHMIFFQGKPCSGNWNGFEVLGRLHIQAPHRKVKVPQWMQRAFSFDTPIDVNFLQPHFLQRTPFKVIWSFLGWVVCRVIFFASNYPYTYYYLNLPTRLKPRLKSVID